ncbi:MAG TPA: TonB-dependent receptor, partial [Kofleriaceae bacterium]|nr:TonB-dependent receptor [Kofleriaceae bacterium]
DAPGYLSADATVMTPTAVVGHSVDDGGRQRALHGSVHATRALGERGSLRLTAYTQDLKRTRWVRFDADAGQQERQEREGQAGAISTVTYRPRTLGPLTDVALEWGVDVQLQDNRHQRFATVARDRAGAPTRDHEFGVQSAGTYIHGMGSPHRLLKVVAGMRLDRLGGSFENRVDRATYDMNAYGTILQPKLSMLVTPSAGHVIYGNYGRTFQVGVGIGAFATQNEALEPSINDGWEAGYRAQLEGWLAGRIAYWQQHASGEVRLKFDDSGEAENIGETLRRGVDFSLTVQPHERVAAWLALGWHTSKQIEPGPAVPVRRGKEIDHIPEYTAKGGVDVQIASKVKASIGVAAQGDYYLTKENDGGQYGSHVLVSGDVLYDARSWLQLGLHGRNLLDARYDSYVWYKDFGTTGTQHNPGDPLAVYASMTARL